MKKDKKYTMLIVDDESIISDELKDLLEENFGDIFNVYNCYHPKKALEIFKYRQPDVVVSDVRMPKMTGIEMAEEMRKIRQDIHVLFLSGYDEFDYVYSAIKQDADDYILKTEGDDTVIAAMKKMVELLVSENVLMEEFKNAQSRISYMAPAFKQKVVGHLLEGDITSEEEFKKLMTDIENPVSEKANLLMILGSANEKTARDDQEKILEIVEQSLVRVHGDKIAHIHSAVYRKSFVWLLETDEREMPGLLPITILDAQKMIESRLDLPVAFGIAVERVKWDGLAGKYRTLLKEMQRQPEGTGNRVDMESMDGGISDSFNGEELDFDEIVVPLGEKIRIMEEFISGENVDAFMEELEEILRTLSKAKRHSMYALEIYYSIANMLIALINRRNIRPQLASKIQLMELFDPGAFITWGQAADYIRRLTAAIFELCSFSGKNAIAGITERTKAYILSNLGSDLSLTAIGQEIGFNPIYFAHVR